MLAIRVATALVIIPIVLLALFKFPTHWFALLLGVVCLLGAVEWSNLYGGQHATLASSFMALAVVFYWFPQLFPWVIYTGVLWWIWSAIDLPRVKHEPGEPWIGVVHGLLTLLPAWCALVFLHRWEANGRVAIFSLLLIIWAADTFAYFAGKRWGKRKLAPTISPGKSVEGVIGGTAGVLLFAIVSGLAFWRFGAVELLLWIVLCMLTGIASILGDLTESKLKRAAGVKDSGKLLPGHGGVLDRIDSITAAAPVFAGGVILLGLQSIGGASG